MAADNFEALLEYAFANCPKGEENSWAYAASCSSLAEELCTEAGNAAQLVSGGLDSILETGGHYGTFTAVLAKKCRRLVCTEKDENRRRLIKLRCPEAEVRLDIPTEERFDLIWINGADEPLEVSPAKMYSDFSGQLTENGEMIMLLPNQKESGFDPQKSAEEISSQGAYVRIIYPYPRLKGAMFFFSEKRLPKESELYFDPVLCDKNAVSDDKRSFADFFMLAIGKEMPETERIFSKMSFSRRPEYRIRTDIISGSGLYAAKTALPESMEHINRLERSYKELSGIFSKGIIAVNKCQKLSDGCVRFDFEEGRELFDIIAEKMPVSSEKACEYIYRFAENLKARATEKFRFTEDFYKMFGRGLKCNDFYSMPYTDIDLCFDNIIVNGSQTVTDYEFCADFPVPVDFVIFRSVFYLFRKIQCDCHDTEEKVYAHLGLDRHIDAFRRMEYNFQQFITGDCIYFSQVMARCAENDVSPEKALKTLKNIGWKAIK